MEQLSTKERNLLENICKKYNWKNIEQIKDLENPNFLSLEIELLAIDKQMMKFASSHNFNKIWRSSTWFDSLQKWFNRTERFSTSLESLLIPINQEEEVQQEEVQEESWLERCINLKYDNKLKVQYKESWKDLVSILKEGLPEKETTKKADGTIDLGCWLFRSNLENKIHKIKILLPTESERLAFVKYLLLVGAIVPAGIAYDIFQQEEEVQEEQQEEEVQEEQQEEEVQEEIQEEQTNLDIRKLTTKLKIY